VNTTDPTMFSHKVRACCAAVLVTLVWPMAGSFAFAQEAVSEEEYARRQQGLLEAIAKMEAEEVRQSAADASREAAQADNAKLVAGRQRVLDDAPRPAATDAALAQAAAGGAAREALLAQLDPPGAPLGGVPVEGNGPAPGAKPIPLAEREKARPKKVEEKREVEILAQGGSTFNKAANLVVFEREVTVNHPQFDLLCDQLIVFLKAEVKEGESAFDRAIATGKKVIVRKVGADGEVQIGQARKVTFDKKSGNIILEDWPQVQSGFKLIKARAQSTIITLNEDGKMNVDGPNHTTIIQPAKEATAKTGDAP